MHQLSAHDIIDRAIGLALGTGVGDAKGIPYETLTRPEVIDLQRERRRDNNDTQTDYARISGRNPHIPQDWLPGRWTDDTQLTLAMMRALTKSLQDGDLMKHIVSEHIAEWRTSIAGWGGTKTAIERLALGTHTYVDSGNFASGNGVLMKLAPLAFFYAICDTDNDDEIERICRMTHTKPVALATACIFVRMCMNLFRRTAESTDFLQYVLQLALKYEAKYELFEDNQLVSKRVKRYLEVALLGPIEEDLLIDVSNGGTYFCVDSLAMVIGLAATSPGERPNFGTVLRAAEIGGDTDSNAAMIGALVGGMDGAIAIDQQHVDQLYQSDDVRRVGQRFGLAIVQYLKDRDGKVEK